MATLIKTPSGKWKAIIRRAGWPLTVKTFRTQRDAGDWPPYAWKSIGSHECRVKAVKREPSI